MIRPRHRYLAIISLVTRRTCARVAVPYVLTVSATLTLLFQTQHTAHAFAPAPWRTRPIKNVLILINKVYILTKKYTLLKPMNDLCFHITQQRHLLIFTQYNIEIVNFLKILITKEIKYFLHQCVMRLRGE